MLWKQGFHPGFSSPESLRGLTSRQSYPRYHPRHSCKHREGFTDLSRLSGGIAPAWGNVTYPTRNFARFTSLRFRKSRTLSWLASIHLRSNLANLREALLRQVLVSLH